MIDLKKANIDSLSKDDRNTLYQGCETFHKSKAYEIFFDHTTNLYISSVMWLNKIRHDAGVPSISNEYVQWAIEMLQFIKENIAEYAQAKDLSQPK